MSDQDKKFEKLAARGREAAARRIESEKLNQKKAKEGQKRDRILDLSLGLTPGLRSATETSSMFLIVIGLVLGISLAAQLNALWPAVAGMAIIMFGGGMIYFMKKVYPNRQKRWLSNLPFEFDLESYFEQLHITAYHRNPNIEVVFQEGVDPALADTICAVVRGALPDTEAEFHKTNVMSIHGPKLATWIVPGRKASTASTQPYYDNSRLHKYFSLCVRKALIPISKKAPILRVIVH